MKKLKKIPKFRNEAEEKLFWEKHDSVDYIDWSSANHVQFPNLRPSLQSISLRLPKSMIIDLKVLANKKDIPYQSLLKIFLAQKIHEEMR